MYSQETKTVYLKSLIENEQTKFLIDRALSTYPMYIPENSVSYSIIPTRDELNEKILNHYKYYQIGFETVGRFIDELKITMEEIMPLYYQKYKTVDVINGIDDIFGNVNITETFEETTTGSRSDNTSSNLSGNSTSENNSTATSESNTETDSSSSSRSAKSDTPQSKINALGETMGSTGIYASEVGFNENDDSSTSSNTGTDTTNSETSSNTTQESTSESTGETRGSTSHTMTKIGNQGVNTYAHDMLEFRNLIINIEQEIINDERLRELFLMVY